MVDLLDAVKVTLNVVQLAILVALYKWVRDDRPSSPKSDDHDQVERYVSRGTRPRG